MLIDDGQPVSCQRRQDVVGLFRALETVSEKTLQRFDVLLHKVAHVEGVTGEVQAIAVFNFVTLLARQREEVVEVLPVGPLSLSFDSGSGDAETEVTTHRSFENGQQDWDEHPVGWLFGGVGGPEILVKTVVQLLHGAVGVEQPFPELTGRPHHPNVHEVIPVADERAFQPRKLWE